MVNAIKLDNNKIVIDLVELKSTNRECVVKHLKELVYLNSVDVFYVIANAYDNKNDEYYFFKEFVETLKKTFNIFLMLETGFFKSKEFYDSIFALGVDALTLWINERDEASEPFRDIMLYITELWPSGTVFTDVMAVNSSDDDINKKIERYAKLKVIPKILKGEACGTGDDPQCFRDLILKKLKENGVSLKWVMNFELCSVIQQNSTKGRSRRKLAGKVAFELASLRRKLIVKEVQSSFDSASL